MSFEVISTFKEVLYRPNGIHGKNIIKEYKNWHLDTYFNSMEYRT